MENGDGISRRDWIGLAAAGAVSLPLLAGRADAAVTPSPRIRLDLNENVLGPSPRVGQALAAHIRGVERYVDQREVDELVTRIARLEQVSPEQIVIGEVLEPLGLYLARRHGGGEVVYSDPGYTALVDSGAALGARAVPVPLNARLENDLPALLKAINGQMIAVNLVNPHNPSGTVNATATLDAFIRNAAKRTLVVVDEAYLEYDDLASRSAVRFVREGADVLVFRTLAKIYGLAGLSIGYALAPAQLATDLRKAGIGSPHSLNRLALVAAAAALEDQAYVAKVRKMIIGERDRINAAIDRLGWQRTDSRANFVFFRPPDAAALRRRFEASGIAVGRPFEPLTAWVRVTIGTAAQNEAVLNVIRST